MLKKLFLFLFLITAGLLTVLYFVNDGVLKEARTTAKHYKGGLRQNVEKAKDSGEEFSREVSTRTRQEKKKLDIYINTKKQKAKEVANSAESYWDKAVLTVKKIAKLIENNTTNIYNLF